MFEGTGLRGFEVRVRPIRPMAIAPAALVALLLMALLVQATAVPLFVALVLASGGAAGGVALILADVTRERDGLRDRLASLERRLEERRRDERATAHDLRAPLSTVGAYLELLAEGAFGPVPGEAAEAARRAAAVSGRARSLVERALLGATEEMAAAPAPCAESALALAEALASLDVEIRDSRAQVEVHGTLPAVRAEHDAIYRVFVNLIENAIKYAGPGAPPRIEVRGERRGTLARLVVRDRGIGIAPEERALAFEEGMRGAAAPGVARGAGLGLATVKRLVTESGGTVDFDEAVTDGTAVRVTFPLA